MPHFMDENTALRRKLHATSECTVSGHIIMIGPGLSLCTRSNDRSEWGRAVSGHYATSVESEFAIPTNEISTRQCLPSIELSFRLYTQTDFKFIS